MPSVLLTGGTGFIGSHTCVELMAAGWTPVLFDNLCNSSAAVLDRIEAIAGRRPAFVEADLRDRAALDRALRDHPVDAVIHFAGLKAVGESMSDPLRYYENNVAGTLVLLDAMRRHGVKRIVFSSSATVYGMAEKMPLAEDAPLGADQSRTGAASSWSSRSCATSSASDAARSMHAAALLQSRRRARERAHRRGSAGNSEQSDAVRRPGGRGAAIRGFASSAATTRRATEPECATTFTWSISRRDTWRRSRSSAIRRRRATMVVNLGTGRGHSVLEVVTSFEAASGKAIPYDIVARRPGDVAMCYADVTRARERARLESAARPRRDVRRRMALAGGESGRIRTCRVDVERRASASARHAAVVPTWRAAASATVDRIQAAGAQSAVDRLCRDRRTATVGEMR